MELHNSFLPIACNFRCSVILWLTSRSLCYLFKRETSANTSHVFHLHLVWDVQAHCFQFRSYYAESDSLKTSDKFKGEDLWPQITKKPVKPPNLNKLKEGYQTLLDMLTFVSISKNELMKKLSSDRMGLRHYHSPDLIRKTKN